MKCEPASKLSLVSGNYHEPAEPVVMVMASIDVKIRHVFADTPLTEESIGAAPPGNNIAQWYHYGFAEHFTGTYEQLPNPTNSKTHTR